MIVKPAASSEIEKIPIAPVKTPRRYWPLLGLGLGLALVILLGWQVPSSFYLEADSGGPNTEQSTAASLLNLSPKTGQLAYNFYRPETSADGERFRWATTNSGLMLPPLYQKSRITLRFFTLLRPNQPPGQITILLKNETPLSDPTGKPLARFDLQPGWHDYSFILSKRTGGPGFLDISWDAPAFQIKGDQRLFTIGFAGARVEQAEAGPGLPPIGSFLSLWIIGMSLGLVFYYQLERIGLRLPFAHRKPQTFLTIIFGVIAGLVWLLAALGRTNFLARYWVILLLLAIGAAIIAYLLRPSITENIQVKDEAGRNDRYWAWLAAIGLLAAFVRLYNLEVAPLGTIPDEVALGYDAYSLLKTGYDHHGDVWPLYFRNYNDYSPGISYYAALPSIAIFGLKLWAVRLPFALLGIGTTIFTALLASELFASVGKLAARRIGIIAGLFTAISPWAVTQARLAMPVSTLSFFFLGGLWLWLRAVRQLEEKAITEKALPPPNSPGRLVGLTLFGSGLMLGIAVWTYPTMKVFIALLLVGMIWIYRRLLWPRPNLDILRWWLPPFVVVCLPFTVEALTNWANLNWRFAQISVWTAGGKPEDPLTALGIFVTNYLAHYDPLRLFFKLTGDYTVTNSSRPALIGIELPALAIPALVGLSILVFGKSWRKLSTVRLILVWLVVFPIADSLVRGEVPDEMRAQSGVGLFEIVAAFGVWWIWEKWAGVKLRWPGVRSQKKILAGLFGVAMTVSVTAWLHYSFVTDPVYPLTYFRYGFGEALTEAQKRLPPGSDSRICVEYSSQAYMYALFYSRFDPATYQAYARQNDPLKQNVYVVKRFGPYEFGCDSPDGLRPGSGDVGVARFPKAGSQLLWQDFYPNGERAWVVVK